jgi:hypothetical protein
MDDFELTPDAPEQTDTERAEEFRRAWNEIVKPPLSKCLKLTPQRVKHITARLKEMDLEQWKRAMRKMVDSDVCMGRVTAPDGQPYRFSFDWLISRPDPGIRLLEGRYDTPKPQPKSTLTLPCRHTPRCTSDLQHTRRYHQELKKHA